MRSLLGSILLFAFSSAWQAEGLAQQSVDVLPVGARVRVVVAELGGRPLPGQVAAAAECVYVSAPFGRDATLGIPLSRIMAIEIHRSDVDLSGNVDRASESWVPVDLDAVLQSRSERCLDQPFTKITPLKWGILIRS